MSSYVDSLKAAYLIHADPVTAEPMKAYMRNQFEFLGIKKPQQTKLLKQFFAENGLPALSDLPEVLLDLWDLPEREFQYAGNTILEKLNKKLAEEFIGTIETLITTKSWWDTVDQIASNTVGTHFRHYPDLKAKTLTQWRRSDDIWLRRTCLLSQLKYKDETDFDLLCTIIRENLGEDEFFINKAIGWALRQYSKFDAGRVRKFVSETPLHPLSAREALKWLNDQEKKKK